MSFTHTQVPQRQKQQMVARWKSNYPLNLIYFTSKSLTQIKFLNNFVNIVQFSAFLRIVTSVCIKSLPLYYLIFFIYGVLSSSQDVSNITVWNRSYFIDKISFIKFGFVDKMRVNCSYFLHFNHLKIMHTGNWTYLHFNYYYNLIQTLFWMNLLFQILTYKLNDILFLLVHNIFLRIKTVNNFCLRLGWRQSESTDKAIPTITANKFGLIYPEFIQHNTTITISREAEWVKKERQKQIYIFCM